MPHMLNVNLGDIIRWYVLPFNSLESQGDIRVSKSWVVSHQGRVLLEGGS